MASYVLKDCKVYVGGYDFSGRTNQGQLDYSVAEQDVTTFGSGGDMEVLPGLGSVELGLEGFASFSEGAASITQIMFDNLAVTDSPMTVAPTTGADGERAFLAQYVQMSYSDGGTVGDPAPYSIGAKGRGPLIAGTILLPSSAAKTSSSNGTGRQLGAVAAGQKVYASLHVVTVSGSTPTLDVIVQSDDNSDFSSATSRITFTQATAIGAQFSSAAGAITDDYWRVNFTIGGSNPSFTFAVAVGIR